MIDAPPPIRILEAIKATLDTADFETDAGIAGVTIRHHRGRNAQRGEKPCISIRWAGDELQRDDQHLTMWEQVKGLNVDLIADISLDTEDSDADPTGWLKLARMLAVAFRTLRQEGTPLYPLMADHVIEGDLAPDEDSTSDEGRLIQSLAVQFRTHTEDPNKLLAMGENGL